MTVTQPNGRRNWRVRCELESGEVVDQYALLLGIDIRQLEPGVEIVIRGARYEVVDVHAEIDSAAEHPRVIVRPARGASTPPSCTHDGDDPPQSWGDPPER